MGVFLVISGIIVLAAFLVAYVVYDKHGSTPSGKTRSFAIYILGLLFSAFATESLIAFFIIDRVCGSNSGAGCGLGVITIVQPIGWVLGMGMYMFIWIKAMPTDQLAHQGNDK